VPEDYTLNVSSPGMGNPLRVREQYIKRIGRQLKITTFSEDRLEGRLVKVLDHGIEFLLEPLEGKSKPGKKKKKAMEQSSSIKIQFEDIKKAILHFNF
jgi:ribosome maturation factor RimP